MRAARILVVDVTDDLVHQVERATASMRPRPEIGWADDVASIEDLVEDQGPFSLIIAGTIVMSGSGLEQLRALRTSSPQIQIVLAFDHWRGSMLREIVRTGALDVLRLPVDDKTLREAVEQALATETAAAPEPVEKATKGTVTTVVSATGGCGKTFFVTNLGFHLANKEHARVCLLDLDLQFGELCTALRLKPRYTIADVLANAEDDDLGVRMSEYLVAHDTGVQVLGAPDEPIHADNIDPDDISRVILAAQERFDHVIIDTSTALTGAMLTALDHSDRIFALATLDLPSVRNLGLLLSTFEQLKLPPERINLALNKVEPDVGIDVNRMTRYFPQGFSMVIPYGREVNRSLNMGQPVLAYAPRGDVSKALSQGISGLMPASEDHQQPSPRGSAALSGRPRWFSRRQRQTA